ncbi:MAG: CHAT domain-containing protein [Candidatus Omnitrophica bacterium]|nr:CHAT domain-containing protein [Candidatus Omnitrophota bacterium]MBL7151127.1 CHAT domain-containing protein [Candidatus Omnitrophota bacterium]
MQEESPLVLDILKQDSNLKMSLFEQKEVASTLRHYNLCRVSFTEIDSLCQEAVSLLNKANQRGALELELIKGLTKTGQLLWDHLLSAPVKNRLKNTRIPDLILSIDEELINIPWELLYDGSNFLCLNFNLGRVVRTKEEPAAVHYRSQAAVPNMLIMANPTDDLHSAYLEGLNIKNQFDRRRNKIYIDFKSTRIDKLYVKKNLCDYDIVHFAGHCEYQPDNPSESGWVLSDGRFTAEDIMAMGSTFSLPTLIFSNACHSAESAAGLLSQDYQKENYGLSSAFLFSGVRHYIGSVRRIEDDLSLLFAKEFYAQLISGRPVGGCMRMARLALIRQCGINNIAWASYLLYGDPNFAIFREKIKEAKPKKRKGLLYYKKQLALVSLAAAAVSLGILLYAWLPSLNPSVYFLLSKSRKLYLNGKNQEVISLCGRIIEKEPEFLAAYPLLADAYKRTGDEENALKHYFEYARFSERRADKKNLASAYLSIGWFYHLEGEHTKAIDFYNKALAVSTDNKDKLNQADALGKMAVWYMDKEDNDKALELLTRSAEINRQRINHYKHRYNLACDYFNLGLLFTNKDDLATAKEFYQKSYLLFEKLKLKHELSDYYFNIGEIHLFEKEYQKALDSYMKGLEIDLAQGNRQSIASDYSMIAELYMAMDDLGEAEEYFRSSIALAKEINARPELAEAYYRLGVLYKKKPGKRHRARECLRQAQEIYRSINAEAGFQEARNELLTLTSR